MPKANNTTFVIGAGASLHAGYPSIASMGVQLFDWMRRQSNPVLFDFAECAQTIEERFGSNIEHVFNGVSTEIKRREPGYSALANYFRPAILEAIRQWFAEIHRQHDSRAYDQFAAGIVKPGDHIITFNYDVSLDAQMRRIGKWCIGDGYGFRAEPLPCGSSVSILKLHGSINWFAPLFGGMTGMFAAPTGGSLGSRPAFTDDDLSALGYINVADPLFPRHGSAALQSLVLPTNRKQFYFQSNFGREWSGFWERLWRQAKRALHSSARVVICGYGMQPIDRRGCNLLLKGPLEAEIEVCCGSDSNRIVQQLRKCSRNASAAGQVFFEDWVSAQTRTSDRAD